MNTALLSDCENSIFSNVAVVAAHSTRMFRSTDERHIAFVFSVPKLSLLPNLDFWEAASNELFG